MYIYKSKTDCSQIYMISAKKGPQMIALTSSNIHMHKHLTCTATDTVHRQCTDRQRHVEGEQAEHETQDRTT